MKKRIVSILSLLFPLIALAGAPSSAAAPLPAIPNVFSQTHLSLNGKWRTIVDPYDTGFYNYRRIPYDQSNPIKGGYALDAKAKSPSDLVEYNFAKSPALLVPRDWNTQDDKLFYYEGSVWYQREFEYKPASADARVFVYFCAANYRADVYLNGKKLGAHIGGFTPFNFEITRVLRDGANSLVVRVNNARLKEGVPTDSTDWWNYGGITRDVLIVETPATYVAACDVHLARGEGDRISVDVRLDGPTAAGTPVTVSIPELGIETRFATDAAGGRARGEISVASGKLQRWSPENPKLYDVTVTAGPARLTERIGFRTIETRGADILLNGKPVFLRGISIHEENPLRGGRAWSREDARLLLGWAKELGCNFARLAHYPHNEHMARVADELGIMLWEEVPVYWTIEWENPGTLANARRQIAELIQRDRNRASVIIWSVANETPVADARTRFLGTLIADVRTLDSTRLISAAMETRHEENAPFTKIIDDPLGALTDIISFNQYVGWYDGLPGKCDKIDWDIRYDKPVIISEFGADALEGFHATPEVRFSEEYQEDVYRRTLPMLERMPGWRGLTPWILADFRSPRRPLPDIQDGWNRKGLIAESGAKKKAWYVLRDYYTRKAAETAPRASAVSLNNQKIDGYKGIWFTLGQYTEYGDKYSGGLSTYTAKHIPLAIYSPQADKTFFVYGGIAEGRASDADQPNRKAKSYGNYLLCMAGCYDHKTGTVSKPTVVHDKKGVFDPHDNPAISMDNDGYIWVFVSGRGRERPGYIYKGTRPGSIDKFEEITKDEMTYPQPKYINGKGFLHLFTKYTGLRLLYFSTSPDGRIWSEDQQLAAIKRLGDKLGGHYQISGQLGEKIVFFFNWHPDGDVDKRTNIYYLQTTDFGKTWTKADGTPVTIPVTDVSSPALVREFFSKGENVYIKDVAFDEKGNPVALYLSGKGHEPGPKNGLKQWQILHWTGTRWENHPVTNSDHNYDTGSLWISGGKWTVIAPTENSPQSWGGGGELVQWESLDKGRTWTRARQITTNSPRNHNYVRKVVNGIDPFLYFWADGNPHQQSKSQMYFGDAKGRVWELPYRMESESQKPAPLKRSKE